MDHKANGTENGAAEREVQAAYWKEHSCEATVESMMLDSKASDIDKMERPEVSSNYDDQWLVFSSVAARTSRQHRFK